VGAGKLVPSRVEKAIMACSCLPSPTQRSLRMCGVIPPLYLLGVQRDDIACYCLLRIDALVLEGRRRRRKEGRH